jgi:26S proteasome regulatory subunit N13
VISASSSVPDAATAVRNFLESLRSQPGLGSPTQQSQRPAKAFPFLTHLMPSSVTSPMIEGATEEQLDDLLSLLPPTVLTLASKFSEVRALGTSTDLSPAQKRILLNKVIQSPQFHQGLGSLTMAIRDGGLPSVAEALGIKVENGGYLRGGRMPQGGDEAVEAFVKGIKKTVSERNTRN